MRFVSDYVIAQNAYREFPLMSMRHSDKITNKIGQLYNNAYSSYQQKLDSSGNVVINEENGNPVYEIISEDRLDGRTQPEFNVRVTDDPNESIHKELRFRRK